MRAEEVTGVVLAGGQSTRMGRDKALLPIAGKPLVRHLAERMAALGIRRLIVACGTEARGREYGALLQGLAGADEIVTAADAYPGSGPLAGLHAALGAVPERGYAFVMACDMPTVSVGLFARLLQAAEGGGAQSGAEAEGFGQAGASLRPSIGAGGPMDGEAAGQAASTAEQGAIPQVVLTPGQPFHALYHASAVHVLARRLEQGDLRLMSLLGELRTTVIALSEAEEAAFVNLNTPELYERFERRGE